MSAFFTLIILLGLLFIIVGSVMRLVVAFREHVLWGVACLFVPFAALVFTCLHWRETRAAVAITFLGVLMTVCPVVMSPEIRSAMLSKIAHRTMAASPESKELTNEIATQRDQIFQLETQIAKTTADLKTEYGALTARRNALKPDDTAAMEQFNTEAAAYTQRNATLKQMRENLAAAESKLSSLLAERAKTQKETWEASTATRHDAKVIMYSTRACPACVAARQYMAQHNVNYEDRDVELSPSARAEFLSYGARGVPLILVDNEHMEGFSPYWLNQKLGL